MRCPSWSQQIQLQTLSAFYNWPLPFKQTNFFKKNEPLLPQPPLKVHFFLEAALWAQHQQRDTSGSKQTKQAELKMEEQYLCLSHKISLSLRLLHVGMNERKKQMPTMPMLIERIINMTKELHWIWEPDDQIWSNDFVCGRKKKKKKQCEASSWCFCAELMTPAENCLSQLFMGITF